MGQRVDGETDGWVDGWMDQWVDGWVGGWIDSMGSMHTVEYYAARKRSEALTQAATWMDLEHMMVGERSKHPACDSAQRKHPEEAGRDRREICGCLAVMRMWEGFRE